MCQSDRRTTGPGVGLVHWSIQSTIRLRRARACQANLRLTQMGSRHEPQEEDSGSDDETSARSMLALAGLDLHADELTALLPAYRAARRAAARLAGAVDDLVAP